MKTQTDPSLQFQGASTHNFHVSCRGWEGPAPWYQPQRFSLPNPDTQTSLSSQRQMASRDPTQAPTAGKFLPSSPQPIRQAVTVPGKYLQKERIPSAHATPTPPSACSRKAGVSAPEATSGPPMTDWESGNECSGELPPPRVRPHQSACWHTILPFNIVKPWPPTEASLLPGPIKPAVKWPPPLPLSAMGGSWSIVVLNQGGGFT